MNLLNYKSKQKQKQKTKTKTKTKTNKQNKTKTIELTDLYYKFNQHFVFYPCSLIKFLIHSFEFATSYTRIRYFGQAGECQKPLTLFYPTRFEDF